MKTAMKMLLRDAVLVGLITLLITMPVFAQSPGYSVQGSGGGTTQSAAGTSGIPNATTDPAAYGKQIFAGTGIKGTYGLIDSITAQFWEGPIFVLDSTFVWIGGDANPGSTIGIAQSTNYGASWNSTTSFTPQPSLTVNQCGAGVKGSAGYYVPCSGAIVRTTDFTSSTTINLAARVGTGNNGTAMTKSPNRLHMLASSSSAGDKHICRSNDLNPSLTADFSCTTFPA